MTAYFPGYVQAIARKKVVVKLGLLVQTCPIIDSGHHKPIEWPLILCWMGHLYHSNVLTITTTDTA